MSQRRLIDTNLIIRYLVQDHARHAKAAGKLFDACGRGEMTLVVLSVVVAECVFVLESFYKQPSTDIAQVLGSLVSNPGVELDELAMHLDALERYGKSRMHFVDCMLAATAASRRVPVATFDSDFKKFSNVTVELD